MGTSEDIRLHPGSSWGPLGVCCPRSDWSVAHGSCSGRWVVRKGQRQLLYLLLVWSQASSCVPEPQLPHLRAGLAEAR